MLARLVGTVTLLSAVGILVVCLLMVVLSQRRGFAFTGDLTKDPAGLIDKYLSLDQRGVRLEASSAQTLKPYVMWQTEPSWGRLVVISDYEVIRDVSQWTVIDGQEALIPVVFHVVGTVHIETATFWPETGVEQKRFHIRAMDDRWRIVGPQLPPHVGIRRLIDYVRLLGLHEPDESRRARLAQLQQALEAAR